MFCKKVKIKISLGSERILHIAVEVDGNQAAAVIGAQGYLTAGVGGDGLEAQVSIAVGHRLTRDSIPEQDARLGTFPRVVNNFSPKPGGVGVLFINRFVTINRILLMVRFPVNGCLHESVIDAHRHVGASHFAFFHLCVNKRLGIRVLDAHREHQGATTTILCHLARTITITHHEGNQTC